MSDARLALEVHPLRRSWSAAAGETVVTTLVKLQPGPAGPPLGLDLVTLVDAGPGMVGERGFEQAIGAVRKAVDGLAPDDRLGVVGFGERARVLLPFERLGDGAQARRTLAFLEPAAFGALSDLAAGVEAAAELLSAVRGPGRAARLLLIVGDPTTREQEGERAARLLAETGVAVSVIGVGARWNTALFARLADAGRGELWHAPRAIDLPAHVREELVFARALSFGEALLHLKLASGVRVRRVLRVFPGLAHWLPSQPREREALVRLGDLPGDRPTFALLELVVAPHGPGTYRLAQAECHWRPAGLAGRVLRSQAADVVVGFAASAGAAHAEAAYYVDRVQGYALIERALEARREEGPARAVGLLESARRIATGRKSPLAGALDEAIAELGRTGMLPETRAKALLIEARQPE